MTTFQRFLKASKLTAGQFARLKGYSRTLVYQWAGGQRRPGRDYALKLETDTGGAVSAESWEPKPKR